MACTNLLCRFTGRMGGVLLFVRLRCVFVVPRLADARAAIPRWLSVGLLQLAQAPLHLLHRHIPPNPRRSWSRGCTRLTGEYLGWMI